jgi:hypothetical protein
MEPAAARTIFYEFIGLLLIVPMWKICSKAGLWPALSLLIVLVPGGLGLLIVGWVLAFRQWPSRKERVAVLGSIEQQRGLLR